MPVAAESAVPDYSNVPLGHLNSDLSSEACNISLNRRRDLSLRQDVFLTTMQGEKLGIQQWLRVWTQARRDSRTMP